MYELSEMQLELSDLRGKLLAVRDRPEVARNALCAAYCGNALNAMGAAEDCLRGLSTALAVKTPQTANAEAQEQTKE